MYSLCVTEDVVRLGLAINVRVRFPSVSTGGWPMLKLRGTHQHVGTNHNVRPSVTPTPSPGTRPPTPGPSTLVGEHGDDD